MATNLSCHREVHQICGPATSVDRRNSLYLRLLAWMYDARDDTQPNYAHYHAVAAQLWAQNLKTNKSLWGFSELSVLLEVL